MQIYSERVSLGEAAITIRGASHNGDRVSRYTVIITITDTINEATITRGVVRGREERVIVPWAVISSCYQVAELPATVAAMFHHIKQQLSTLYWFIFATHNTG